MSFDFVEKVMCIGGNGTPDLQFYKKGFNLGGSASPSWQDIILSGNTALTLTNALANGLNYLKLFGGTEQRNLPSEYTQVEYLQSSGTQWIDTGIVLNSKATITTVGQFMSVSSPNPITMWGFMGSNNMPRWGCSVYNNMWLMDLNFTASQGAANTNKHTFVNETNGTTTYDSLVDGVPLYEQKGLNSPQTYTSNVLSAYIFARNNTNTAGNFSSSRIYNFNIVQDDVEVINLIPARRNSDNVLGMYDTVTGNFLTNSGTGTFTAGADITAPSPDNPIDIVCNNGVVKVSKNLFDKSIFVKDSGSSIRYTSYQVPNGEYTMSSPDFPMDSSATNVFFLAGDVSTGASSSSNGVAKDKPISITVTNGYYTVAHRYQSSSNLNHPIDYNWQIEKGSTATPYAPYSPNGIYTDGIQETVTVTGKNLFDVNNVEIQEGTAINADGSLVSNNSVNTCITYISVKPNTTYTISGDILGTYASFFRLAQYKADKTFIIRSEDSTGQRSSYPFTTGANTYYIRFHYIKSASLNTYQLELGSTATSYEPYTVLGTTTAENLFAINTYKDVQEVLAGNVTRNIGVKVLDGTEDWTYNNSAFLMNLIDRLPQKIFMFCTHFNYDGGSSTTIPNLCIGCGSITNTIFIKYQTYNTVEQFKSWLADQYVNGTPVIVIYPLATATTETVTGQELTTQAGTNIITAEGSIDNLGLEVSYKATV